MDENKHEVIIPFNHRALLYDVAENYGPTANTSMLNGRGGTGGGGGAAAGGEGGGASVPGVVNTNTLVEVGNKFLPRVFRHVLGEPPALAHAFTGILRCYSVFTEETVMAATVNGSGCGSLPYVSRASACLELATDSSARFNIALNASELKKTNQYAVALKTCEEQAPSYVRAIKVSFTVRPVITMLDDLDLSLYDDGDGGGGGGGGGDGGEEEYRGIPATADSAMVREATQANAAAASSAARGSNNEDITVGSLRLDTDSEATDRGDDDSVTTDDVDGSLVDVASLSDATDVNGSESCDWASVSDMVEVDANSEFDISWGQLKRARSFSGSISTLTDSGTRSSCNSSDSEDSVVGQGENHDSSLSHNSTLTKDTNSSASGDTVVLRASAASPVYANVQKKSLSVFNAEQRDGLSSVTAGPVTEQTGDSSVMTEGNGRLEDTCVGLPHDSSVRSVWNITPTVEEAKGSSPGLGDRSQGDLTRAAPCDIDGERLDVQPINWGDDNETESELLLDSNDSIMELHHTLRTESGESSTSTLERHPKPSAQPILASHPKLSTQSSAGSSSSSRSAVATSHPLLSARSSVQSEGSAQDLAIQRLEKALNDASNFLSVRGPPLSASGPALNASGPAPSASGPPLNADEPPQAGPTPPQRRGRPKLVDRRRSADEYISSTSRTSQHSSRDSLQKAGPSEASAQGSGVLHGNVAAGSSFTTLHPLPAASASASGRRTAEQPRPNPGYDTASRGTAAHHQSHSRIGGARPAARSEAAAHHQGDPRIDADWTAQKDATAHRQSDGQIDLDFVKTLGDKLMAVSRKTSLPKYQRLQPNRDTSGEDGVGVQDGLGQFQKKKKRPGSTAGPQVQYPGGGSANSSSSSRDDDWDGTAGARNAASETWGGVDSSQREVILDELDLLQEEAV